MLVRAVPHLHRIAQVMAATIAGLFTSLATTIAKRMFGIKGGEYHPGKFKLAI